MFQKYSEKSNPEGIFKRGKMVFLKIIGVQEVICRGGGRNSLQIGLIILFSLHE